MKWTLSFSFYKRSQRHEYWEGGIYDTIFVKNKVPLKKKIYHNSYSGVWLLKCAPSIFIAIFLVAADEPYAESVLVIIKSS